MKDHARTVITGFARFNGRPVGIWANQPAWASGVIDCDAADKGARFIRFCDLFNIPVVTFQDCPGYMIGSQQEWKGILRHGAKLLYAWACATVPLIAIIIRSLMHDQVCVCFMGESVVNTGAFHEALNMAGALEAARRLRDREQPLRHGHGARARVGDPRHLRARRGVRHAARRQCDGQDVFAVRDGDAARRSSARAPSRMPTLLEVRTYRFMGHSMSDAVSGTYRTQGRARGVHEARPDHAAAHAHAGSRRARRRRACTSSTTRSRRSCRTPGTSPSRAPSRRSRALYEDVLVDTTT